MLVSGKLLYLYLLYDSKIIWPILQVYNQSLYGQLGYCVEYTAERMSSNVFENQSMLCNVLSLEHHCMEEMSCEVSLSLCEEMY